MIELLEKEEREKAGKFIRKFPCRIVVTDGKDKMRCYITTGEVFQYENVYMFEQPFSNTFLWKIFPENRNIFFFKDVHIGIMFKDYTIKFKE